MKSFRMKLTKIQAADRGVNLCLTRWSLTHDTTELPRIAPLPLWILKLPNFPIELEFSQCLRLFSVLHLCVSYLIHLAFWKLPHYQHPGPQNFFWVEIQCVLLLPQEPASPLFAPPSFIS